VRGSKHCPTCRCEVDAAERPAAAAAPEPAPQSPIVYVNTGGMVQPRYVVRFDTAGAAPVPSTVTFRV
jgi:hypothetical protein